MTKRDQQVMEMHPGQTPYQLFHEHGISKRGYDELISNPSPASHPAKVVVTKTEVYPELDSVARQPANLLVPERVVVNRTSAAQPALSAFVPRGNSGENVIIITRGTGKKSSITRMAAERLVRNHPNAYYIE